MIAHEGSLVMSARKKSMLSALLSVVLTAMLSVVMMPVTSIVYAADEKPYKVNYVTYYEDQYIEVAPISVAYEDAGLNYKGDPDEEYTLEEEYTGIGLRFMGWYSDRSFQEEYKVADETKYRDIAGSESVEEVTLYAKIEHLHGNKNYTPWGYSDKLPEIEGDWYLLSDVKLSSADSSSKAAWTVPTGGMGTSICLNGHSITYDNNDEYCSVISVPNGANLTITDCSNNPGSITGGNAKGEYGGGIVVNSGGTLNMEQGIIRGNEASHGGGIAVMGGGTCNLSSGNITDNTARIDGGGVYVDSNATLQLGPDNTSTLKITNNKVEDKDSDVSISGSSGWKPIKVGGLSSNSKIGIETRNDPAGYETGLVFTDGLGATDISVFTSNDDRFEVVKQTVDSSEEAALKYKKLTVKFVANGVAYGDEQTIYGGQTATKPADPEVPGFVEWLLNGKAYDFTTPVTENLTLVARFDSDHHHDDHLFTAWTKADSLPTEAGNYYLTEDVTLPDEYKLNNSADVHICLNGHDIKKSDHYDGSLITVEGNGSHLSIYDCKETGKLTGATETYAVHVRQNGTFTLNGGMISDNAAIGLFVHNNSNAIINGGTISNNTIRVVGFNEDERPSEGIRIEDNSSVRMNGGTISGNEGSGISLVASTLELGGGQITGNTTIDEGDEGAGIFLGNQATIRFTGTDKITITGNTYKGKENNVYLPYARTISFAEGCAIDPDSRIGITTVAKPTDGNPVVFTDVLGNHATAENFISDDANYQVRKNTDDKAELYVDPEYVVVSFNANGGSGSMKDESVKIGSEFSLPESAFTAPEGKVFDKWQKGDDETAQYDPDSKVSITEATTFKATWKDAPQPADVPVENVSLDQPSLTLEPEQTATLAATVTPDNATNKNVTWSSSDTNVATVDENGVVTAVAEGTATITVATEDGNKTATCAVTVNKKEDPTPKPDVDPTPTPTPTQAKAVLVAKGIASGKKAVKLSWNKVADADRYVVYLARCDYKGKTYKFKAVKTAGKNTFKWTKKKLKKKTYYKFYVLAQKKTGNGYTTIAKSNEGHFVTGNVKGKFTNPKSLKLNKTAITLNKGGSAAIKGTVKKAKKGKKLMTSHAATYRYISNNPAVATVAANGTVTAKSSGSAVIYVQTINGIWKTVKVTVR